MDRRRFLFAGLFGAVATALATSSASAAITALARPALPEPLPAAEPALAHAESAEDLLTEAQYGPPRRGRRRPRCWVERRRIAVRGRNGRLHYRWVDRRVCR